MRELTHRQRQILEFVRSFIKKWRIPPTFREIGNAFSISVKAAYDHIKALEKKNFLECRSNQARSILLLDEDKEDLLITIPLIQRISSQESSRNADETQSYIYLPQKLIPTEKPFAFEVTDDSMEPLGILKTDVVIIAESQELTSGDIIATTIQSTLTLRRYYTESNRIHLVADNKNYPALYTQSAMIHGKLVYLMRSYFPKEIS